MKKQSIWVFQWRKSVHYWWSYILFSPECKELTSMLDPLLYRWGVPPVVIRCVHWTMQMWVLQTWIKALGLYIVMTKFNLFGPKIPFSPQSFWVQFSVAHGTPPAIFGPSLSSAAGGGVDSARAEQGVLCWLHWLVLPFIHTLMHEPRHAGT